MISVKNSIFLLVVIGIVGLGVYIGTKRDKEAATIKRTYAQELRGLATCSGSLDIVTCASPFIPKLLDERPATDVIDAVVEIKFPTNQCHYVVHIIGREIYQRTKDITKALEQCSRFCNSACLHGVISEAFTEEYGVRESEESGHASSQQILEKGKNLCTDRNTCHGVGHALLVTYDDLDTALAKCTETAAGIPLQDCYRGTFMEYSDGLSNRSLWLDSAPEYTSTSNLASFCDRASAAESAACYYFLPIILRQTYRKEGIDEAREDSVMRIKPICLAQSDSAKRRSCVLGFGVTLYQMLQRDEEGAIRICEEFPERSDQVACMAGMFSLSLEYGRTEQAITYCSLLSDRSLRPTCYRAIFEKIDSLSGSIDDAKRFCPVGDTACVQSAETVKNQKTHEFF